MWKDISTALANSLQYVTNIYALVGLIFLGVLFAVSLTKISPRAKTIIFAFMGLGVLLMVALLIDKTADKAKTNLIRVARDEAQVRLSPRVEVRLMDIETLKPNDDITTFGDREHLIRGVFSRSRMSVDDIREYTSMTWHEWKHYVDQVADTRTKNKLVETPFAKFEIIIDSQKMPEYSKKWYFKGEDVVVSDPKSQDPLVTFEVIHVYNTKHDSSGEHEAVFISSKSPR